MKIISFIAIIVSFATESLWSAQQESHRLQIEGRVEIPDTIEEFLNQELVKLNLKKYYLLLYLLL